LHTPKETNKSQIDHKMMNTIKRFEFTGPKKIVAKQNTISDRAVNIENDIFTIKSKLRTQIKYFEEQQVKMRTLKIPKHSQSKESQEFFKLVKSENVESVLVELSKNKNLANEVDNLKETPLHWAVKRNNEVLVGILLAHDANPDAKDLLERNPNDLARKHHYYNLLSLMESKSKGEFFSFHS